MKINKPILTFLCSLLGFIYGYTQELPDVLPQSPEAAALGQFGQVPVGLFTGTPQMNIPIFEFKSSGLSLPISLGYSSNGVRVDGYSSSVGMGWNLNAGGVITRTMYGRRDENQYWSSDHADNVVDIATASPTKTGFVIVAADGDSTAPDTQPDIFSFNFNGYSGKFYLDDNSAVFYNRDIVFLEPTSLKVEIDQDSHGTFFEITDPTGVKYHFGGLNAIESSKYFAPTQVGDPFETFTPNAWYLTSITHPSGEVITLSYINETIGSGSGYGSSASQSVTRNISLGSECQAPTGSETPYLNKALGDFSYLSQISSSNSGTITFNYSDKTAMPGGFKKLDKVIIKNQHDVTIKSFNLAYDVVTSSGSVNTAIAGIDGTSAETYMRKRYYLSSVTEEASDGKLLPSYEMDYNTPELLPTRFSYAQDYWGFYNGKNNTNLIGENAIDVISSNPVVVGRFFGFAAADRDPDPSKAVYGTLSKITYPTSGSTELSYEGHQYYGDVETLPNLFNQAVSVTHSNTNSTASFDTPVIPFDHSGVLSFGANIDDFFNEDGSGSNALNFDIASVIVHDITNGGSIAVPIYSVPNTTLSPINGPYGITNLNFTSERYVTLQAGRQYRFTIILDSHYTNSSVSLGYYKDPKTVVQQNTLVGGLRIKQVVSKDAQNIATSKTYHYGTLDCLNCDTGAVINRNIAPNISESAIYQCTQITIGCLLSQPCERVTIASNTAFPLYGVQGYHIGYRNVIEEYGPNFEGGAMVSEFEGDFNIPPSAAFQGNYIQGTRLTNVFNFGRQIKQTSYRKHGTNFIKVQEVENFYTHKPELDKDTKVYAYRRNTTVPGDGITFDTFYNFFYDITQYNILRQWHVMSSSIATTYDTNGNNPSTTTQHYFYDNANHLQRTKVELVNSEGLMERSETLYPHDIVNRTSDEQQLIDSHQIAVPIQQITSEVDNANTAIKLSEIYTKYKALYPTNPQNNLILPERVQTQKQGNAIEDRIVYHQYDDLGNPLEVSIADGSHIVYLWGYNQQYPVAKIENATYSQVLATGVNLNVLNNNSSSDAQLTTELNKVRNGLANALVSTYLYNPDVGTTTMTDSRGYTMTYRYDTFNRLIQVADQDGNLISENDYHYKNQN